jgi:hypothetical protein
MAEKIDKLQLLRTRYLERIREIDRVKEALKERLAVLDELESEYKKLESGEGASTPATANGPCKAYAATGLTEAVFDAVGLLGQGKGVSAGKVADYLLGSGYKPKGKNFKISVGTTLRRLAKDRIATALRAGARVYMPKTE